MASIDCSICCEPFNRSTRKKIVCEHTNCSFIVCKTCVREYILSKELQPQCMRCKQNLSTEFIIHHLNRSFMEGKYKQHRKSKLLERAMSQLPEAMPEVIRKQNIHKKRIECDQAEQALKEAVRILRQHKLELRDLHQNVPHNERTKFIMACSRESCRGFLTDKLNKHVSHYQCGLCEYYTCSKCLCVKGLQPDTEHTCDPEHVASAECIKLHTRPCPACGERISKIDGCDQMWCITCHTAFSWARGTIENGVVHNPHYFQYQKTQTENVVARQVGLGPCNPYALPDYHLIRPFENRLRRINPQVSDMLLSVYQIIAHMHYHERLYIQRRIHDLEDTQLKVRYLMGNITKEQFASELYSYDYNCMKERMILNVMDVLNDVGIETLWGLVNANESEGIQELIYKEYEHFIQLCEYCNRQWLNISLNFRISVPWITVKKEGCPNVYLGILLMMYRKKNVYKEFLDKSPEALKLEIGSLEMDTLVETFASIPRD